MGTLILGGGARFLAIGLVIAGMRAPQAKDPIQERLAEFSVREEPISLEEIELSQRFRERIILPFFNRVGQMASRFTPQATLETTRKRLGAAGNPQPQGPPLFPGVGFALG